MEAIATLKPALYAPRLGAAGASVSRVQIMHYASGNLANFIVCGVFDWVALFLKKKKIPTEPVAAYAHLCEHVDVHTQAHAWRFNLSSEQTRTRS